MMTLRWLFGRNRAELKIVLASVGLIMLMPLLAVIVVTSSGVAAVSAAVASINPVTHEITIFEPDGAVKTKVSLATMWPTTGYVSDEFGTLETFRLQLHLGTHTGIDIANAPGTPIYAFLDGTVIQVDDKGKGNCGIFVRVQHIDGISSLYCHMSSTAVFVGEAVKQGDLLGLMGTTGASIGPHLHFQINVNSLPVNPRTFISGEPDKGTAVVPLIPSL